MQIEMKSNKAAVKSAMEAAVGRALIRIGMQAEGYAKDLCPVDTGYLRDSIANNVCEAEGAAYIGTNTEYAPEVELGTHKMAAQPFLKPAVADHAQTYRNIMSDEMKGA